MEAMSINQKIFAIITLLLSAIFFHYLYQFISGEQYDYVVVCSTMFGTVMFLSAFTIGYKDKSKSKMLSLGFVYHLITYLIVNVMGTIFLLFYMGISFQSILTISSTLFFWGLGLAVHYYFGKKRKNQANIQKHLQPKIQD